MTALESTTRPAPATGRWEPICAVDALTPDRGVAALVGGRPVAVFLTSTGDVHAVDNVDPCSGASVLSRGIVGERDGVVTVASPMYKQRFSLVTGQCLDDESKAVTVHDACVVGGVVHVRPVTARP